MSPLGVFNSRRCIKASLQRPSRRNLRSAGNASFLPAFQSLTQRKIPQMHTAIAMSPSAYNPTCAHSGIFQNAGLIGISYMYRILNEIFAARIVRDFPFLSVSPHATNSRAAMPCHRYLLHFKCLRWFSTAWKTRLYRVASH